MLSTRPFILRRMSFNVAEIFQKRKENRLRLTTKKNTDISSIQVLLITKYKFTRSSCRYQARTNFHLVNFRMLLSWSGISHTHKTTVDILRLALSERSSSCVICADERAYNEGKIFDISITRNKSPSFEISVSLIATCIAADANNFHIAKTHRMIKHRGIYCSTFQRVAPWEKNPLMINPGI